MLIKKFVLDYFGRKDTIKFKIQNSKFKIIDAIALYLWENYTN